MNEKSKIYIAVIIILAILFISKCDNKAVIEKTTEKHEETSKTIKSMKDSIVLLKEEQIKLKEEYNKEKDSLMKKSSKAIVDKTMEIERLVNENKKMSSTFIKFDYAEEIYGLGKNIKNLTMTRSQFEQVTQSETRYKELERKLEEATQEVSIKEKENKLLEEDKSVIENENRVLISRLDSIKNTKIETENVVKQAKPYSITVDAKGLYGTEGLEGELNAYVKKYIFNFEQDGVFISGGYTNTDLHKHTGFVGIGIEF